MLVPCGSYSVEKNVPPKQEGVSTLACSDICGSSNYTSNAEQNQMTITRCGDLEQFVCSVNAVNTAAAANSFDICCLATSSA